MLFQNPKNGPLLVDCRQTCGRVKRFCPAPSP
jgi:hypothetical protein